MNIRMSDPTRPGCHARQANGAQMASQSSALHAGAGVSWNLEGGALRRLPRAFATFAAVFAALAILAVSVPVAIAQTPPPKVSVTLKVERLVGKLERIDVKQNTVAIRLEKEVRVIRCAPECRVFNTNGKLAKLADLQPGTVVEVSCVESQGNLAAQRITPVEAFGKDTRLSPHEKK